MHNPYLLPYSTRSSFLRRLLSTSCMGVMLLTCSIEYGIGSHKGLNALSWSCVPVTWFFVRYCSLQTYLGDSLVSIVILNIAYYTRCTDIPFCNRIWEVSQHSNSCVHLFKHAMSSSLHFIILTNPFTQRLNIPPQLFMCYTVTLVCPASFYISPL